MSQLGRDPGPEWEEVLHFWLGELDPQGRADPEHSGRWWRRDPAFDQLIRDRFGRLHAAVLAGERAGWLASPRGRLATIIVLDQLARNMFRGSPAMHEGDARAVAAAREGIDRGVDRELAHDERAFLYMPLMHSEELADQDRCVALMAAWRDELDGELREGVAKLLPFAEQHRDLIRRFGRFPHRNTVLGRPSTPEEEAFLQGPRSSFY